MNPRRLAAALVVLAAPCARAARIQSVAGGAWSSTATWGGAPPGPGDDAVVAAGHTVVLDSAAEAARSITVRGDLCFGREAFERVPLSWTPSSGTAIPIQLEDGGELAVRSRRELQEDADLRSAARISYLYSVAHTAYASGDSAKALRILQEILKLSDYPPAVRLTMDILQERQQAPEQGAGGDEAKKALDLYYEAIRRYGMGDLAGAAQRLRDAEALDPDSAEIRSTLERVEREQGRAP